MGSRVGTTQFEAVIGLEVHAELATRSKMFCACPVVDPTVTQPNVAVCPVCAGMPGVLPVINQRAVEFGLRVALALECEIPKRSLFARKNYFYPDLPKGYQISQYEYPLAVNGGLTIRTEQGERRIRVRRVHLEEDTGKLTHVEDAGESYSLIDLNRAGVPLLEIVSEPDMHTAEEVRAYAVALRSLLRYLEVSSGDMQKGALRVEPNISIRPTSSQTLGTRVEIKNLNSFRALERAVSYEIQRQIEVLTSGGAVVQETLGWDEARQVTVPQRGKEEAHDYRYFPEPDLPPLVVEESWVAEIRASLPERPYDRLRRFEAQYELSGYEADVLTVEKAVAEFFEQTVEATPEVAPKTIANWITGEVFAWMNETSTTIEELNLTPDGLGDLLRLVQGDEINQNTAKKVLAEMLRSGKSAGEIVEQQGLRQISGDDQITALVESVLADHPTQLQTYLEGKETIVHWLFGQVMRRAKGRANPKVVRRVLLERLGKLQESQ